MAQAADQADRLRPRQEIAVRRFTQYCRGEWGSLLIHKVGTGKTMTSMAIGFNSLTTAEIQEQKPGGGFLRNMYIVSPSAGIFQNFIKDLTTRLQGIAAVFPRERLINYTYAELIEDINNKSWRHDMSGSVVIFDEAHRLLSRDIFNSREAGSRTERHPILEDIYFLNKIKSVKKCIVMTGTPIQVDLADICRLLNFVSQTNNFRTDIFAALTFQKGTSQWCRAMFMNFLKSKGSDLGAMGLTYLGSKAASFVPAFLTSNPILWGTLATLGLTVSYLTPLYEGSKRIPEKKANAGVEGYQRAGTRKRKVQRGGYGWEDLQSFLLSDPDLVTLGTGLKESAMSMTSPMAIPSLLLGPSGPGKPPAESISKFLIDMYIAGFQESTDELYLNNWDVKELAQTASKYISVYDPSLQIKLKQRKNIENNEGPRVSYNSQPISNLSLQNIESIKVRYYDDTAALDMPNKLEIQINLSYDENQLQLLRDMFTGSLTYKQLSWLNLDRYESASPDVKGKYKFFRSYGRMVGNYSADMLQYYTVINADGTDYELYERETGRRVEIPGNDRIFFNCEKFRHCLAMMVRMRTTSRMKKPVEKISKSVVETARQGFDSAKESIKRVLSGLTGEGRPLNEAEAQAAALQLQREAAADILSEANEIPQPHLTNENQYLPLVYSYTEDYGLGPFCIFLKSQGYKYILAHTKQAPDVLVNTINRGKSFGDQPLFARMTEATQKTDMLCVLLHPSMTEGYDFVYNPAIFVLEPCNTFGDQEQVYGRVLRSYSKDDVARFQLLPSNQQKKNKLIVQYVCLTDKDSWVLTKLNAIWAKGKFWDSRLYLTPQQYLQTFQRAAITSPDFFGIGRLKTEKDNLEAFEKLVKGGIDYSDILESLACFDILYRSRGIRPGAITCDPESGIPCADTGPVVAAPALAAPVVAAPANEQNEENGENEENEESEENDEYNLAALMRGRREGLRYRGPRGGYRRTHRKTRK